MRETKYLNLRMRLAVALTSLELHFDVNGTGHFGCNGPDRSEDSGLHRHRDLNRESWPGAFVKGILHAAHFGFQHNRPP